MPETVFQESAGKHAIGVFFKIKIFRNTACGHVTEVSRLIVGVRVKVRVRVRVRVRV